MKLNLLNEEKCAICKKHLTTDDAQYMQLKTGRVYCQICGIATSKKNERERKEEAKQRENLEAINYNQLAFSKQMPDRSYDERHGTPGFVMGEPTPGRAF